MAAEAPVSLEEYLGSSYQPDLEYIDGALEKRNAGPKPDEPVLSAPPGLCIEILYPR